jgi:hypothetical protein
MCPRVDAAGWHGNIVETVIEKLAAYNIIHLTLYRIAPIEMPAHQVEFFVSL